jgi:recombination associated protein RdgC
MHGFLKGGLTFSRYTVVHRDGDDSAHMFDRQIKASAFRDFFPAEAEKNLGWTGIEDVLDTEFAYARYAVGDYRLFALRIDRRSAPPALLKIRCMEGERRFLQENRLKRLYKDQREAIRESVRMELLAAAQPVPAFFEVAWSVSANTVLFSSLSPKIVQEFLDLFKTSFGLVLQPTLPWDPALLESQAISPAFLGREFLTWLWCKAEERNGMISLGTPGDIEIAFVRRLALESGEGEYAESVVCQGQHADLHEGKEAIRQGKKIKEARIILGRDAAKWEFSFKADTFHFQSLRLPVPTDMEADEEEDKAGRTLERMYLVETAVNTMDDLFARYLSLRLSPDWPAETTRMEKWAASRD